MVSAAEFLKWLNVFKVTYGGGSITIPVSMGQGGTGAALTPSAGSLFYSTASQGALLPTIPNGVLVTDAIGNPSISTSLPTGMTVPGYLPLSGGTMTGNLTLSADPTTPLEAATKQYADAIASGFVPVGAVYCASTGNLAGYVYNNGSSGVGATLTAGSNGVFTADSATPPVGQYFLYKDDSTYSGIANGIYQVTTSSGGTHAVITRATYYNSPSQIKPGTVVSVENGTLNMGSTWYENLTVSAVGTDPIAFSPLVQPSSFLLKANNLSDVASIPTTVANLGLTIGTNTEAWSAVLDQIAAGTYTGSTSITTLGTVTTGTWNGSPIIGTYGGTGVNNGASTITVGGNVTFSGAYAFIGTLTADTNVTFPTSGTLATTSQIPTPAAMSKVDDTNVTLTLGGTPLTSLLQAVSLTLGWTGTLSGERGGTGVNNGISTITIGGNFTLSGAFAFTGTLTNTTNVTFPTSGTLATTSQLLVSPLTTKGDIWVYSTVDTRLPVASGDGKILQVSSAAATGLAYSTPTYPSAAGSSGHILRSNGTNNIYSSNAWPDTCTTGQLPYCSGTNVISMLATLDSAGLLTNASGVPGWVAYTGSGAPVLANTPTLITPILGTPMSGTLTNCTGLPLTTGVTGILPLANGGTNNNLTASLGGIVWSDASELNILAGTATANLPLLSGSSATPAWGTYALSLGGALTTAGALTLSGAFGATFTFTNTTSVTFPTSGTLATTAQIPTFPVSLANGGTNASLVASAGSVVYSTASAMAFSGVGSSGQLFVSQGTGTPVWTTTTYPLTNAINTIMYASSANVLGVIAPVASSVMISSAGGVPSWGSTLPTGVQTNITELGTITVGTWGATTIGANFGGTGVANLITSTITLGGAFSMIGAFSFAGTLTGNTTVTFPQSGTLAVMGAGGATISYQTTVNFGSTGVLNGSFTVTNAAVTTANLVNAQVAYVAPSGKTLDELEFDQFDIKCVANNGSVTMFMVPDSMGLVAGNFVVNYTVG